MIRTAELIDFINKETGVSKKQVKLVLDGLSSVAIEHLPLGETIILKDIGRFAFHERRERQGVNPATKAPMMIPAHNTVKFVPTKLLKMAVNHLLEKAEE